MKVRATYKQAPVSGLIRISKIVNNTPVAYELTLMHDINGVIPTKVKEYKNMESAIASAVDYGFNSQLWKIEEINL